jgi:hypothetical protein
MNRYEAAERLLFEIDALPADPQNPYAFGLRAAVAAVLKVDDKPQVAKVSYSAARDPDDGPNAHLLRNVSGECWILYDEIDGDRAVPAVRLLRPSSRATLTYVAALKPTLTLAHPDGWSVTYRWDTLRSFDDANGDEEWVRGALHALAPDQ